MDSKSTELKILDYWYVNELLSQEHWYDEGKADKKIKKARKTQAQGKAKFVTTIEEHFHVDKNCVSLEDSIEELLKQDRMKVYGDLTVYFGKSRREKCVETIAKKLGSTDDSPEKSRGNIAWASLQLEKGEEGFVYKSDSFSLSPIIWAIGKLNGADQDLSDTLSYEEYQKVIDEINEKMADDNSIDVSKLRELFQQVKEKYVEPDHLDKDEQDKNGQDDILIVFNEYVNNDALEENEEDGYSGLSQGFFLNDIAMVHDAVESDALGNNGMEVAIQKYISEPYLNVEKKSSVERKNIIHVPEDKKADYAEFLSKTLDVRVSPEAKWPSRYRPALMQQIAINEVTGDKDRVHCPVFSVNGPPGTGKTTMLKEIVANNIVERAKLLAKYDKPDDAFADHEFEKGMDGNPYYSEWHKEYYTLKNDAINDYSMLVTSSNNTAVENITKELPIESKILGDMKTSDKDSPEVRQELTDVADLFSVEKSTEYETFKIWDSEAGKYVDKEFNDIYFSELATALLGSKNDPAWGLVAVSLGKRSNINAFTRKVLRSVIQMVKKNTSIDQYQKKYEDARNEFRDQEKRVRNLQEQIGQICDRWRELTELETAIPQLRAEEQRLKAEAEKKSHEYDNEVNRLSASLEQNRNQGLEVKKHLNEVSATIQSVNGRISELENQIRNLRNLEIDAEKEADSLHSIFSKKRKEEAEERAARYRAELDDLKNSENQEEAKLAKLSDDQSRINQTLKEINDKCRTLESQIDYGRKGITALQREAQEASQKRRDAERNMQSLTYSMDSDESKKNGVLSYTVLNEDFIDDLLSDDEKKATDAQISNPWFTLEYDAEREKLLRCAIKLNKYFILSSKDFRHNMNHLYAYWSGKYDGGDETVRFDEQDKKAMLTPLYQTLFLLVPVVSTTFASVGRFLSGIKEGAIGTLVVDEAGQAQPQMALGALYRSRQAIIVGDPRQVEPVVTDDLKLLKSAFKGEIYSAYKKKNISVQKCADLLNPLGNYLEENTDQAEWVGCPLVVHRRCISPMYDISNAISYDGMMKQQTALPSEEKKKTFVSSSCWINVEGTEAGHKNHYNQKQGQKAAEIVFQAFSLAIANGREKPSLYIITPFTTVVEGIKKELLNAWADQYQKNPGKVPSKDTLEEWSDDNIGTVHKFQGKEADQVIFLLGCDGSKGASGAVQWVNENIVNVAVTRAKYRVYIIGDGKVWADNDPVSEAKKIIDTYKIREIASDQFVYPATAEEARSIDADLPALSSFPVSETETSEGEKDQSIDSSDFIQELETVKILSKPLTDEQVSKFGFKSADELSALNKDVRKNLEWGIRLFYLLEPIYKQDVSVDASCCAILFCKALELHVKDCLEDGFKNILPNFEIKGRGKDRTTIRLSMAKKDELTLGTFDYIIKSNFSELSSFFHAEGDNTHDASWWETYERKLFAATNRRNNCCHTGLFDYKKLNFLLADMFKPGFPDPKKQKESDGLMFTSKEVEEKMK